MEFESPDLTATDRDEIATMLLRNDPLIGKKDAVRLSDRWSRFTTEVEEGYELTIYDYENELDGRYALWRVAHDLAPRLRDKLERVLEVADARFLAATDPLPMGSLIGPRRVVADPGQAAGSRVPKNFGSQLYTRVPRTMGEDLRADLVDRGLLRR